MADFLILVASRSTQEKKPALAKPDGSIPRLLQFRGIANVPWFTKAKLSPSFAKNREVFAVMDIDLAIGTCDEICYRVDGVLSPEGHYWGRDMGFTQLILGIQESLVWSNYEDEKSTELLKAALLTLKDDGTKTLWAARCRV